MYYEEVCELVFDDAVCIIVITGSKDAIKCG